MNVIKTFTKNIKNYKKIKKISNVNNISYHHERYIISKIIESFNAIEISNIVFKDIIKTTTISIKPKMIPGMIPARNRRGMETSVTRAKIISRFDGGIILPKAPAAAAIAAANRER